MSDRTPGSAFFVATVGRFPDAPGATLKAIRGAADVEGAAHPAHLVDSLIRPASYLARLAQTSEVVRVLLVALKGEPPTIVERDSAGLPVVTPGWTLDSSDVIGCFRGMLPQRENTHVFEDCELSVRPEHQRQGVGTALLDAACAVARHEARTHLIGFSSHSVADPDVEGALLAPEGNLAAEPDSNSDFVLARGFRVAQIERFSVLDLASFDPARLPGPVSGYRLVSWHGAAPEPLREAAAHLTEIFSAEVPKGDLALSGGEWDSDRLARAEEQSRQLTDRVATLALHEETGEPVGLTVLVRERDNPEGLVQAITIVPPAHRGHGLGLAMKLANLATQRKHWPDAVRVNTWNAGENDAMWRINESLGFLTVSADVGWQREL